MSVALSIALSLGILFHGVAMPIFAVWVFVSPQKRWQTGTAMLACLAGIFSYLLVLTDSPAIGYVGLGLMRGLFEVQRSEYLRVSMGPIIAVFGLVFFANSLGYYTFNRDIGPVIVGYVASVVFYSFALLLEFLLRLMQGSKSKMTLSIALSYIIAILVTFALSEAMFDVISETLEFYLYVFLDLVLLIFPAVWHAFTYRAQDPEVQVFDYLSTQQGIADEIFEIEMHNTEPDRQRRRKYYQDDGNIVPGLPETEEQIMQENWRAPQRYLEDY